MDHKGITWVGHVYHKFEAMCLEVEEIMYQDTVKYVENQVQTVGLSVKKFYSDVIEDLLPPSSVDHVKGRVASNLPAEQDTDVVGVCKKPKVGIKEKAIKVEYEQLSEDSVAAADLDKGAGHGQSFHGFHIEDSSFQASYSDTIKGACSDVYSKENDARNGHDQSSLCLEKSSKEVNLPPSERYGEIPLMERDLSRGSSSCEPMEKIQEPSDDQVAANSSSVTTLVAIRKFSEDINDELGHSCEVASSTFASSPSTKTGDVIENSSVHSSCSSLSAELDDICMSDGAVSLIGSFVNEDIWPSESDKITSVCHPGPSDYSTAVDTLDSSIVIGQGFETIQRDDNFEVEETCVLVTEDELHFVPHKEGKPRAYKKKIQDAISSKMRSVRKHEYKQLAVWYEEDVKSKQENVEMKRSPSNGSCELEWELL